MSFAFVQPSTSFRFLVTVLALFAIPRFLLSIHFIFHYFMTHYKVRGLAATVS